MRIKIRRTGNATGMVIPIELLQEVGLESEADVIVAGDMLIVRATAQPLRSGWAQASRDLAQHDDDGLVMPGFGNADDGSRKW